ncbi:hypothetical protein [Subtercola sp. YIM 133946]|uniref:hypothetical protein n=1 Tax=Subtercola sp. YIM 133946 TaxID=3118909 RepID=UPI002F9488FB
MSRLRVTLACEAYDRTIPLLTGAVRAAGIDINYLPMQVEETFHRMVKFGEFDVSELSLSSYVLTLQRDDPPFIAIPVFPSRSFRHGGIYVNTAAGIAGPGDLVGRRVGIPEYQVTAAVWIRGMLADRYGVPVASVTYKTGGLHAPGRVEKEPIRLPPDVDVTPIADDQTLVEMLVSGEIDALYSPRTPQPFRDGDPRVGRLFEDLPATEAEYFRQTRIFPVMHVVALRRDVYDRNRWMARSLFDAFEEARRLTMNAIDETAALRYMLPWLQSEVERTRTVMGADYWRYGVSPDDPTLATFLRYSHDQGLAHRLWSPDEIFAKETLDAVIV